MKKKIPEFRNEDEEFEFWSKADSTEYLDWSKAKRVKLPNLKPSLRTISIRLPVSMVEDLKILANQRDVPYQSLMKVFLAERVAQGTYSQAQASITHGPEWLLLQAPPSLLVRQRLNSRQLLALQKLQARAAARRDMRNLVCNSGFLHC